MKIMEEIKKINRYDFSIMITLFGTAIGAGILFLPIRVGLTGLYPIIILAILIIPMTFLSHLFLARFSIASKENPGVTNVAIETFGKNGGLLVSILYFFAIYPICLAYGVGITNTIKNFMENQLGIPEVNRWILAVILVSAMMAVVVKSKAFVVKMTNFVTFPLIIILFGFSLYLIPMWRPLSEQPAFSEINWFSTIFLAIPTLVFAFNHSPAVSRLAISIKEEYEDKGDDFIDAKLSTIFAGATALISFFALFFVISFIMTLPAEAMSDAKKSSLSILAYFASIHPEKTFIVYVAPIIALTAIVSSFFGHYLGAHESLVSTIKQIQGKNFDAKKIDNFAMVFIYITMIIVAGINTSILGFIEDLGGPFIAMMLYIMPVVAVFNLASLEKFEKLLPLCFIATAGTAAILAIIIKFMPNILKYIQ